jgi:FkbH-like protein
MTAAQIVSEVRASIDTSLHRGDVLAARAGVTRLWSLAPSALSAAFILSRREGLCAGIPLAPCRVVILRSFTVEPMVPALRAAALAHGVDLTVTVGEFGAYAQELLDPASLVYCSQPDVVIVAVATRDIAPELWDGSGGRPPAVLEEAAQRATETLESCIRAFRERSRPHLIVHTLELPHAPATGILDAQTTDGQASEVRRVNDRLVSLARQLTGVFVLDYDSRVARHGKVRWHDERKWLSARVEVRAELMPDMAHEWSRYLVPLAGRICKVVVVDLDNTLWGGTVGEDGLAGLHVGLEYPGAAFRNLQRALLDLSYRGILLAVCSKNNREDALEVMARHPGMLLRETHFAALRINWQDKAENLVSLAEELNVGLDSLAFLDDNPVERERVRTALPMVHVIELSDDAMTFADAVRQVPGFERVSVSDEDRERGQYYAAQRLRAAREQQAPSLDAYLASLEMHADIAPLGPDSLARAAQLTQKTNQFNLTTRRYSEQELASIDASRGAEVLTLRLSDRFGDNGIVGLAITRDRGPVCEIDTFLLSCRVIGRRVETALLAAVAEQARSRGMTRLLGIFISTRKNSPAASFYESHGFVRIVEASEETHWEFDLTAGSIATPACIARQVAQTEMAQ